MTILNSSFVEFDNKYTKTVCLEPRSKQHSFGQNLEAKSLTLAMSFAKVRH